MVSGKLPKRRCVSLMKNLSIAIILSLFAIPAFADPDEKSFIAKVNENGKFCAKIDIRTVNGFTRSKMKCRSIEQWENMGYDVDTKKYKDEEDSKKAMS